MKLLTVSSLVLFGVLGFKHVDASITPYEARDLMREMGNISGRQLVLHIENSDSIDAYTDTYSVHVTTGMLNFVEDREELAHVLGHEIAHYTYGDPRTDIQSPFFELRADKQGYKWCKQAGYKNCTKFMRHIQLEDGDGGEDGIHPSWSERIRNVEK